MAFETINSTHFEGSLDQINREIATFLYDNKGCDHYHFSIAFIGNDKLGIQGLFAAVVVVTFNEKRVFDD